jgi:hypothetical protein
LLIFLPHHHELAPTLVFFSGGPLKPNPIEHIISASVTMNVVTIVGSTAQIGTTLIPLVVQMKYVPNSYVLNLYTPITPLALMSFALSIPPVFVAGGGLGSSAPPGPVTAAPAEFAVQMDIAQAQLSDELNVLSHEIFNHNYFLEQRCDHTYQGPDCYIRAPLEYRKHIVSHSPSDDEEEEIQ